MSRKKKQKEDITAFENREALCPHFGVCGGCAYQKISYDRQLEMKLQKVKTLIDGVYGNEKDICRYELEGIVPSPFEEGYRNKMEFSFGDEFKDGPFALGLHQKGSFMNIVNITDCHLIHNDLNIIINATKNFFNEYYEKGMIDFHNKKNHTGWLRHLLLRRAEHTGEILVALVTDSDISGGRINTDADEELILSGFATIITELELEGKVTGVLHIINDSLSDVIKNDKTEILYGRDHIYDEVLGLRFKISVFSFFQTNTSGAELLYSKVREYAGDTHGTLLDLYSGTGTITQLMSHVAKKAIGVEIVGEAVKAAKENALLNSVQNVEFIEGDVLKILDEIKTPDALIMDPPREGIHPKALGKILAWGVRQIVYVSCKPESLARDLESFKIAGYEIKKLCCVDMFPQTSNIEVVVKLSRVADEAGAL